MAIEFPLSSIGSLASSISETHDMTKERLIFLNTSDILNGKFLHRSYTNVSEWPGQAKKSIRRDDILFSEIRPANGRWAYVDHEADDFVVSTKLMVIRTRTDRLLPRYLYHFLTSTEIRDWLQHIAESRSGTFPQITFDQIASLAIPLPPVSEQIAIARILGTLDDKIELNRQMNATLEAMARALFKSWFVDFDPVRAKAEGRDPGLPKRIADLFPDALVPSELGETPKGWRVGTIRDIADVIDCLHAKKPERQSIGQPLLQLNNICDDGSLDLSDTYLIEAGEYAKWVSRMEATSGDCLITNVGRVGAVAQVPIGTRAALGRNMTGVRCLATFPFPTFLLEVLRSGAMRIEITRRTDSGTILDALNVRSIPGLRFTLPPKSVASEYEKHAGPLRAGMNARRADSQALHKVRDTLLPKLISGEIRVKDAERFVEAAV